MINPAEIPQIPGDMAALGQHAAAVTAVGTAFPATGAKVHSTWQGLAAVYSAPESAQLFAATGPVQTVSASVGEDLTTVGGALQTYSTEVGAIKARLELLRSQATTFVSDVAGDDDWRDDQGKVNQHNQLLSDVNGAVADFMDAQRRCANTILACYSTKRYTAENGDGTVTDTEFGYTKDMLDAALTQDGGVPWGKPEEHDRGFLGDVGAFFVGVKDGAVGFVQGLGGLVGYAEGDWSWSNAGTAWKGLGIFALSLSAPLLIANQFTDLPGLPKGTLGNTLLNAGKGLIAYDTWKEDKSKAAGEATFNIVSAVLGTKGAGAGLRGAGAAAEASRFATVAKVGAGAVKAGEFIAKVPKVSDVVLNTIKKFPGFKLPHIDLPSTDIPTTHVDGPRVEVPGGHTPSGASVADGVGGGRPLPPGATITNHGVVPGHGFDAPAPHSGSGVPIHDGVIGGRPHVETPAPTHGADTPTHADAPGSSAGDAGQRPLPPGATITHEGVVTGHGFDAPTTPGTPDVPIHNGVIGGHPSIDAPTTPHGADAPPHADAPGSSAGDAGQRPLPPGATITHEGVVPGHGFDAPTTAAEHGVPLNDGVLGRPPHVEAPAPHADAPAPHGADAPVRAEVPAERELVPSGAGGGPLAEASRGIHLDENGVVRAHGETPVSAGAAGRVEVPAGGVLDHRAGFGETTPSHTGPHGGTPDAPTGPHTGNDGLPNRPEAGGTGGHEGTGGTGGHEGSGGNDAPGGNDGGPAGDHPGDAGGGDHNGGDNNGDGSGTDGADSGPGGGDGPPTSVTSGPAKDALIEQLKAGGTKINDEAVVRIGQDSNGRIVWLEEGGVNPRTNKSAGLHHVLEAHADDFGRVGVARADVPELVHRAVTEGRYTGYAQGSRVPGRPIFAIEFQGRTQYVAVSVGKNGYIVGASPRSLDHPFEGSKVRADPPTIEDPGYRGWGK